MSGNRKDITAEEVLALLMEGITNRQEMAKALGISERNVRKWLAKLRQRGFLNADNSIPGAVPGEGRQILKVVKSTDAEGQPTRYSITEVPLRAGANHIDPKTTEGGRLARLSTYRGADGEINGQWEIQVFDKDDQAFLDTKMAMLQDIPSLPPVPTPTLLKSSSSLVNVITLADVHIGGLTWKPETGADWDLKIAEELLTDAFRIMIEESPAAETCFISLLGDWLHYDKLDPETTLSGNVLSADGRREKMVDVAIRVARRIIETALGRYGRVVLLIAEGNHDILSATWLRRLFQERYGEDPRVEVIHNPLPFYAWDFGEVFIGWHHGHLKPVGNKKAKAIKSAEELVNLFSDEFAPQWGRTKKRYIHTGHLHTKIEVEPRGAQVIQHPTLASRDDFAARYGWGSIRSALCLTYHETFGERFRNTITPEMVAAMKGL